MTDEDKDLMMRRVAAGLAVVVVLGFLGMGVALMFFGVPPANKDLFLQFSGALTLAFGGLMSFLYGRSTNSDMKDRALAKVLPPIIPPTPAPASALADAAPSGTPSDPVSVQEVKP